MYSIGIWSMKDLQPNSLMWSFKSIHIGLSKNLMSSSTAKRKGHFFILIFYSISQVGKLINFMKPVHHQVCIRSNGCYLQKSPLLNLLYLNQPSFRCYSHLFRSKNVTTAWKPQMCWNKVLRVMIMSMEITLEFHIAAAFSCIIQKHPSYSFLQTQF